MTTCPRTTEWTFCAPKLHQLSREEALSVAVEPQSVTPLRLRLATFATLKNIKVTKINQVLPVLADHLETKHISGSKPGMSWLVIKTFESGTRLEPCLHCMGLGKSCV